LFALAVIELIHIPIPAFRARPLLLPQAFVRLIAEAFLYCWVNLLSVGSLVFIQGAVDSGYSETAPRRLKALQALIAFIPAAFAYYLLQLYEPFALYPPFIVAFVGVAFLTWANFALPQHRYWQAWSKRCEPHSS